MPKILAEKVLCNWEKNSGRYEKPPIEYFAGLASNIKEVGQIAPVYLRKNKDKQLEVEIGFCRYEAFIILNRQERASGKEEDELTLMEYVLDTEKLDEKALFLKAQSENGWRTDKSPMDFAFAITKMIDVHGMTQAEVADWFNFKSQGSVSGYKSLMKLSKNLQNQVHNGEISYTHALQLLKEPEQTRQALVDVAKAKDGKVTGRGLQEAKNGGNGASGNPKEVKARERNPSLPQGEDIIPVFTKNFVDLFKLLMSWEKKLEKDKKYISGDASMVISRILSWGKGKVDGEYLRRELNTICPFEEEDLPVIEEEEEEEEREEGKEQ